MQPLNALRGYSDFFKSGFPAFTNRGRGQSSPSHNSDAILNTSSLTTKATSSGKTKRRPRPVSMIVQNIHRVKAQRRWTWFDHLLTTHSFNGTSTISSSSSICPVDSRDSLPDVLTAPGGSYTIPALKESSDEIFCRSIDPFSSALDAKSTFMQDDDCALGISKPDFFTASSNRSSSITIRREPPVSIRSMSRSSSLQYHRHSFAQESDLFRVVEEEDLLFSSEVMEVDHDASAKIDWRQFHVDVLTDDDI